MQTINLSSQYEAPTIQANKYETGRKVAFHIVETIENIGTAVYIIQRPNGTQIKGLAEIDKENNNISFTIPANALLEVGIIPCVLSLYIEEGAEEPDSIISSFDFYIDVRNGLLSPEGTYQLGYDTAMQEMAERQQAMQTLYDALTDIYDDIAGLDVGDLLVRIQNVEQNLETTTTTANTALTNAGAAQTTANAAQASANTNANNITTINTTLADIQNGDSGVIISTAVSATSEEE